MWALGWRKMWPVLRLARCTPKFIVMGVVKDLDSRVSLDLESMANMLRNKRHKSSRKANKKLKKDTYKESVGSYFTVKTNVGLAPFNTRRGTEYLIPANSECIAVQMQGWLALYLTNGLQFDSIEDVKAKCKHVRAKDNFNPSKGEYAEVRVVGKPIFRDAAKVAFKAMLPVDWANDAIYNDKVRAMYP